jgi:Tfp pilus assembly protein PilP
MKLTTGILFLGMVAGTAWGQNPDVINNTRSTLKAIQQKQAIDSNAALAASPGSAASPATPASGAPGPAARTQAQNPAKRTNGSSAAKISAQPAAPKVKTVAARKKSQPRQQIAVEDQKKLAEMKADVPKQINLSGRRDPFVSPVVNRSMLGSGCSTGKRCLAIDQINLKGVVKSDVGMIAVVVNSLNKAYFLRENDPVFHGYVVRITGDSIIFKETVQDRLGKPLTREVTKKITTSAV